MTRDKEKKACSVCAKLLPGGSYSQEAWEHNRNNQRKCRTCIEESARDWKCKECARGKSRDELAMWLSVNAEKSPNGKESCDECYNNNNLKLRNHWRCIQCKEVLHKVQFSQWAAKRKTVSNKNTARCNTCTDEQEAANIRIAKSSLGHIAK